MENDFNYVTFTCPWCQKKFAVQQSTVDALATPEVKNEAAMLRYTVSQLSARIERTEIELGHRNSEISRLKQELERARKEIDDLIEEIHDLRNTRRVVYRPDLE